jgi:hypothetical protein
MNKLFIAILFIGFGSAAIAQQYHPLIRPDTYWDVFNTDGSQLCWYSGGDRHFFEGDTIILGTSYKILRAYEIIHVNPGPFCPPYAVDPNLTSETFFMREDTADKKVYFFYSNENADVLLYDFSLDRAIL